MAAGRRGPHPTCDCIAAPTIVVDKGLLASTVLADSGGLVQRHLVVVEPLLLLQLIIYRFTFFACDGIGGHDTSRASPNNIIASSSHKDKTTLAPTIGRSGLILEDNLGCLGARLSFLESAAGLVL